MCGTPSETCYISLPLVTIFLNHAPHRNIISLLNKHQAQLDFLADQKSRYGINWSSLTLVSTHQRGTPLEIHVKDISVGLYLGDWITMLLEIVSSTARVLLAVNTLNLKEVSLPTIWSICSGSAKCRHLIQAFSPAACLPKPVPSYYLLIAPILGQELWMWFLWLQIFCVGSTLSLNASSCCNYLVISVYFQIW